METIEWDNDMVKMIDQTKLPLEEVTLECRSYQEVAEAIRSMKIRGAPAIGVAAAFGIALATKKIEALDGDDFLRELQKIAEVMSKTRPTAVNLFWAIERMIKVAKENKDRDVSEIKDVLVQEALSIYGEDIEINKSLGKNGASLIGESATILTHCNAGALATAGYGTALGVIRAAWEEGKDIRVFVDETRPFLQGARLTAWEMVKEGIPATLITDNMAGYFMSRGEVDLIIVGADRIAANGDTANKIGTYTLAVLAKENGIPFYIAAPLSTIDLSLDSGEEVPIEERNPEEVLYIAGKRIAPEGIEVANPAFDVTPNRYVSAIITEKGIIRPPYAENLRRIFDL